MLTPEQIKTALHFMPNEDICGEHWTGLTTGDVAKTLAAYAEVVQGVAETEMVCDSFGDYDVYVCPFCHEEGFPTPEIIHAPDCLWARARRLRGME